MAAMKTQSTNCAALCDSYEAAEAEFAESMAAWRKTPVNEATKKKLQEIIDSYSQKIDAYERYDATQNAVAF